MSFKMQIHRVRVPHVLSVIKPLKHAELDLEGKFFVFEAVRGQF